MTNNASLRDVQEAPNRLHRAFPLSLVLSTCTPERLSVISRGRLSEQTGNLSHFFLLLPVALMLQLRLSLPGWSDCIVMDSSSPEYLITSPCSFPDEELSLKTMSSIAKWMS